MSSKWTKPENEELLRAAVATNKSIAAVARALGLAARGGNYQTLRHHIARLDLDVSHHTGALWNKGTLKVPYNRRNARNVRAFLISECGHRCWECGLDKWQGQPIPLEVDHINGDHYDNSQENLRILCANCHSLTPTFRNKKRN